METVTIPIYDESLPNRNNRSYDQKDLKKAYKDYCKKNNIPFVTDKSNRLHISIKDLIKEDKVYELQLLRQWE